MIVASSLSLMGAALLAFPAQERAEDAKPTPSCGVTCLYAVLKMLDRPQSLEKIGNRLEEINPNAEWGLFSVADLRKCAESFGLQTAVIRTSSPPTPSILYIRPPSSEKSVPVNSPPGHFIVLKNIDNEAAVILDLQVPGTKHEFTVPLAALHERWDGTTLMVSPEKIELDSPWREMSLTLGFWVSSGALLILLVLLFLPQVRSCVGTFVSEKKVS